MQERGGPGRRRLALWGLLGALGASLAAGLPALRAEAEKPAAIAPAARGSRGPFRMVFSPDGARLYVAESDEGDVAVVDPAAGKVVGHLPAGEADPQGLALSPNGQLLAVANGRGDSVGLVDPAAGRLVRTIPLRGTPADVVFTADGETLCVALSQLDEVALVTVATGAVAARIPVGRHPRALALSPTGALVCLNMTAGSVSVLDLAARRESRRIQTPAVNLRGVALSRDGRLAFVTGQRAQNERATETAVGVWSNQLFAVSLRGGIVDNIWLDFLGDNAADPDGIVVGPDGRTVYVACGGGHSVQSLKVGGEGYDAKVAQAVGAGPRALALAPGGRELWAANSLGSDLVALDPATLAPRRRVDLGPPTRPDPRILGRFLFRTASITRGGQFSCNSCHTDGGVDGISWKFTHVKDGLQRELRNVRDLRGPLPATGPFRWTGAAPDLKRFIHEEVAGLLQGPALPEREVEALAAYIASLPALPNPYRAEAGAFTPAAQRGQALFAGKAGCATCHSGPHYGGQRQAWIGTTPEGVALDVPHLEGVYDTEPYLHAGQANTLAEIFTRHDPDGRHGAFAALSAEEQADLLRFVQEL
jgi:YVTN family beta-propeller protein